MFESGFAVAFGLLIIMFKAPWSVRMWMLSHPLVMDLSVFIVLYALHAGTYSGGMVATIGALMVSLILGAGKKLYGHKRRGKYVRGMFDVSHMVK